MKKSEKQTFCVDGVRENALITTRNLEEVAEHALQRANSNALKIVQTATKDCVLVAVRQRAREIKIEEEEEEEGAG